MNTLKTLMTSALFASVAIASTAQAENPISNLTYEDSQNMFSDVSYQSSGSIGILSYGDSSNKKSVWSIEFEEYVNPADFQGTELSSISDVNQYMGSNPTAAGSSSHDTFIYNEVAGEYHLQ